jgi:membrane protease YdiL (CAAX protease family)
MTGPPEQAPLPQDPSLPVEEVAAAPPSSEPWTAEAAPEAEQYALPACSAALVPSDVAPLPGEPPLFQSWSEPEIYVPARIPHLGHLFLLGILAVFGLLGASLLTRSALYFHLFGISTLRQALDDIHYTLGGQGAMYLITLGVSMVVFPLLWHKGFFAGLQWNGATALRLRRRLFGAASICFVIAVVNGVLMPGPNDTPIDKIFRAPGAAWLLFAFGVTFAPFFEEVLFRGFLLPALCTACDWIGERINHTPARPLAENGHPQWSLTAMGIASVLTSIGFSLMHAEQTSHAVGPFLLLICVSLVLCWARLSTRSLAASVLVHASYNFMLFALMLLGTGGFRHLDKM